MSDDLTDDDLRELQDPASWDNDNTVTVHPAPDRQYYAEVTIRLDADMLDTLERAADHGTVWLPYYIRDAAIEKARGVKERQQDG